MMKSGKRIIKKTISESVNQNISISRKSDLENDADEALLGKIGDVRKFQREYKAKYQSCDDYKKLMWFMIKILKKIGKYNDEYDYGMNFTYDFLSPLDIKNTCFSTDGQWSSTKKFDFLTSLYLERDEDKLDSQYGGELRDLRLYFEDTYHDFMLNFTWIADMKNEHFRLLSGLKYLIESIFKDVKERLESDKLDWLAESVNTNITTSNIDNFNNDANELAAGEIGRLRKFQRRFKSIKKSGDSRVTERFLKELVKWCGERFNDNEWVGFDYEFTHPYDTKEFLKKDGCDKYETFCHVYIEQNNFDGPWKEDDVDFFDTKIMFENNEHDFLCNAASSYYSYWSSKSCIKNPNYEREYSANVNFLTECILEDLELRLKDDTFFSLFESVGNNINNAKSEDIVGDLQLCYDFNDVRKIMTKWVNDHHYGIKIITHKQSYNDEWETKGQFFVVDESGYHTLGLDYSQHFRFSSVKDYWAWDLNFSTIEAFRSGDDFDFKFANEDGFVIFFGLNEDGASNGWYVFLDKDFNYHYCKDSDTAPVITYKDVDMNFIKRFKHLYIAYTLTYTSSDFKVLNYNCEVPYMNFSKETVLYYKNLLERDGINESVGANIDNAEKDNLIDNADDSIIDYKIKLTKFLEQHHNRKKTYRAKVPYEQYGIMFARELQQMFPGWKTIRFRTILTDRDDDFFFEADAGIGYGYSGTTIKEHISEDEYQGFLKNCYEYCQRVVAANPDGYNSVL